MAESIEMGEINDIALKDGELGNGELTKDVEMKDLTIDTNKCKDDQSIQDVDMEKDSSSGSMLDDEDTVPSPSSASSEHSLGPKDKRSDGFDELDGDTNTNSSILPEEDSTEHSNLSSSQKPDDDDNTNSCSTGDSKISNDRKTKSEPELIHDDSESKTESAKNDHSENSSDQPASVDENHLLQDDEVHHVDDDDDITDEEEIDEDDDDEDDNNVERNKKSKQPETIELNSEDEGDVMIVDGPKSNGTSPPRDNVINLVEMPEKKAVSQKMVDLAPPRRSTRNLNKSKSYVESDKEDSPPRTVASVPRPTVNSTMNNHDDSDESDIEEILPEDPLAGTDQVTVERIRNNKKHTMETSSSTIVVKDTKKLVEIASKTNHSSSSSSGGKKEPTLVIIDTNSILSGRGAIPVSKSSNSINSSNMTPVLPMAVPAQGMYPPNMRATITPIPVSHHGSPKTSPALVSSSSGHTSTPLLPTLTDDMFVVEAPSFIVPYVYEKPPVKQLKQLIADLKKDIDDSKKEKKDKKDEQSSADAKAVVKRQNEDDDDSDVTYSDETDEEDKLNSDAKPYSYFQSALGSFFVQIGSNIVQEHVQNDLLKQQKRKRDREQGSNPETNKTIASLMKNIEMTKENNEPYRLDIKKCEFCNFKTESALAMAYHLETPHMKNFVYKCNFCTYEVRSPHDILFHMEAEHAIRGHLERAPAFHQCPSCPFEDNQKGKLSRHLVVCARKFKAERNLEPPIDWEPPAKIPRLPKMRASGLNATVAAYQTLASKNAQQYQFLSKMQLQANANAALNRGRGRPTLGGGNLKTQSLIRPQNMGFKTQSGSSLLLPSNYHLTGGNSFYQVMGGAEFGGRLGPVPGMAYIPTSAQAPGPLQGNSSSQSQSSKKSSNTPSISITPLPRGTTSGVTMKPGDMNSKSAYVICEICDGYIRDLEQLRNHMQWIHKIKIHPKMIHNRPPLNCQKCQFRFFTDQGLERHLLGSHGLVTSSMQDAANKSKDSGRCPLCGKVYQWKLLNHVARDHGLTLKPAHLSYKCTVCTATFGMYKQFENHVYSAHSVVAKRVMDKKSTSSGIASSSKTSDMKPLKINDEITIIPQPAKSTTNGANREGSPAMKSNASTSKSR